MPEDMVKYIRKGETAMGLFGKKKSDKNVMILMMDCETSGELKHIIEEMTDRNKEYAMESVCNNFVRLLYGKKLKQYQPDNIKGVFPNHWDAPLYRQDNPRMQEIAVSCARDYICKNLPGVDADAAAITVDTYPGRPYASIFFEY